MGVKGKLEGEIDIKSSGDLFHELFGKKPHHITNVMPHKVHTCDVHEGDFGQLGCVISWSYTFEGRKCTAKEIIEEVDEEKKYVRYKVIEGDLLNEFKSLAMSCHVICNGPITAVNWIIEFEKITDDSPYPTKLMEYLIAMTRDVEAHHTNA